MARIALNLDPDNAMANNNLAWALVNIPSDPWFDPKEGLALAKKAVALEPEKWHFLNTLGVAAFRTGDFETATEILPEVDRSQPAVPPTTCSSWR